MCMGQVLELRGGDSGSCKFGDKYLFEFWWKGQKVDGNWSTSEYKL
jgi:hypothetical protein